jgi:CRISPR system Cascade subunit CasB
MTQNDHSPLTNLFIDRLGKLDAGGKARLKRCAGKPLSEARDSMALFYRLLPSGIHPAQEEWYFLIATLYPLADGGKVGNLGDSLRRAASTSNGKGVERRVEILLDGDAVQLPFRLRQAIRFLKSNNVTVNWAQLLEDVLQWNHPKRFVQKQWARAYFADAALRNADADQAKAPANQTV